MWKYGICHFHWGAVTRLLRVKNTIVRFLNINIHNSLHSGLFSLTGAIIISLLSCYLPLLQTKATGRFTWEFFLDRGKKRAWIWGSGTMCCLWDHDTDFTLQLAIISIFFKVMTDGLALPFPLTPDQQNQTLSLKNGCFFVARRWCRNVIHPVGLGWWRPQCYEILCI